MLSERDGAEDVGGQALLGVLLLESLLPEGWGELEAVFREYRIITAYTERRLRRWLMKKHKRRGTGYRQYPNEFLYEKLGLFKPWVEHHDQPSAKSRGPG